MAKISNPRNAKACPVCGNPTASDHAPFCSRGCKDRDLLKWLGGGYAIPGPPIDTDGLDSDGANSIGDGGDGLDSDRHPR